MRPMLTRLLLAFLAALALFIAVDNLQRPLANPDEGRYSEISREMVVSGDWVTPRLNGIRYFEKPPLQYWATAAFFRLLGENEAAARLYVLLCGLATVLLVGYTGWRLAGAETGLASMLVLASSPYFMAMGGIVTLDMGLTFWTTATFCAFVLAERLGLGARARRGWMLAAWAAMGLAVLSKGLVGIVFPAAAIGLLALARRDLSVLRRLEWSFGPVLFAVIAAPWFMAVSYANPSFPEFFFIHEHFARFLTHVSRRVAPWWYFIPIVFLGFLPWMLALPAALVHGWRAGRREEGTPALPLAVVWGIFIVVFFSASGSKLPGYILPAFPPLALVVGRYLVDARPRTLALCVGPTALLGVALTVFAGWYLPGSAHEAWTRALYVNARPWAVGAAVVTAIVPALVAMLLWRGRRWPAVTLMAIGIVLVIGCIEDSYERVLPRQSGYEVAQIMKPLLKPGTRVYQVKMYDQTVPFYIGRTTTLVDYGDEFETGLAIEPSLHIRSWRDFPPEWLRPGDALAIMQPDIYDKLRERGLPMQVLHEDPRRVLVRKP